MNVITHIEAYNFILISEQKQKFAGWKYRSISVKYKPSVTNASSILFSHRIFKSECISLLKKQILG